MDSKCLSIEELGAVVEAAAADPRKAHIEACPRCRALMAAYRKFLAGDPGLSDLEMEKRLNRALHAEIHGVDPTGSRGRIVELNDADDPAGRRSWFTRRRVLVAAAAVLVLSVAMDRFEPGPPSGPTVLRSDAADTVFDFDLSARLDSDSVQLDWRALPRADAYRVEVMNPGFEVLATFDTGSETSLVLGPEEMATLRQDHGFLIWRVSARVGSDFLTSSVPQEFPVLR